MIQITRVLAQSLRTMLRKTFGSGNQARGAWIILQSDNTRLRIRSLHNGIGVEQVINGSFGADTVILPYEAIQEIEGPKNVPVVLEQVKPQRVQIRWGDGGIPQVREFESKETKDLPTWPEPPATFSTQGPSFLSVLAEAMKTAADNRSARFALDNIQLRGSKGQVVATDGKQLLVQSGFSFPWTEDVLVPAVKVFDCRVFPQDAPVSIGKAGSHVFVSVGEWSFLLPIDTNSRYANFESVIPAINREHTIWRLDSEDAQFLARSLPRLPVEDEDFERITVDLDRVAAVRAKKNAEDRVMELVLDRSCVNGPKRRFGMPRRFLARAIDLGFREFHVVEEHTPVVCSDLQRTYVWMTLGKEGALPPADSALRIRSSTDARDASPASRPQKRRATIMLPSSNGNGTANGNGHANGNGVANSNGSSNGKHAGYTLPTANKEPAPSTTNLVTIITEAESLQETVRDTSRRLARLVSALKRHRRQNRLMSSTLASLRQLQQLPAAA